MKKLSKILLVFWIILLIPIVCNAQLAKDKYYHIGAGVTIATGTHFSQGLFCQEMNPIAPSLMALSAGFAKEVYDGFTKQHFSHSDLAWTFAAGVVTNVILRSIHKPKPKKVEFIEEDFNPPLVKK